MKIIKIITLLVILNLIIFTIILFINPINFVKKDEFKNIIDKSIFFENMNDKDLKVRNVKSKYDYKELYYKSYKNFNLKEKLKLWFMICKINYLTNGTFYRNIKWKFVKIDKNIENGFPHTIGDIIVLYNIPNDIDTLIHEKFHIYQRKYSNYINKLYSKLGFKEYEIKNRFIKNNKRNNPDIDKHYIQNDKYLYIQLYKENPLTLSDSKSYKYDIYKNKLFYNNDEIANQNENPNEITAELLPKILRKKIINKEMEEWIKIYL